MESDSYFYFIVIMINIAVAVWGSGVLTALFELSWAKIRKLDPEKRMALITNASKLLENRTNYRIIFRLVLLTNLAIVSILFFLLINSAFPGHTSVLYVLGCGVASTIFFVLVTELIGNGLLASRSWLLLDISMPVLKILFMLVNPLIHPAILLQKRLNLLKEKESKEEKATTADEIMSLVENDAHQEAENAALEASERQMIRGIFDLDETQVKEIMTPRVDIDALKVDSSISEVRKKIVESGHSRIPVYKDRIDEIQGFIYAKDLLNEGKIKNLSSLKEIIHPPVFIPETKYVSDLLEEFKQSKNHIAVVIDEYGGTAGLVTFEDILEEIVGEIRDEYDSDEDLPQYLIAEDGALVADGRLAIDEINQLLKVSISDDEEYDTIGGYVTSELGRIPKTMEVISLPEIKVQILEADDRKVSKLKLHKITKENGEEKIV